jgi:molybdate transport system ATP-binding protein
MVKIAVQKQLGDLLLDVNIQLQPGEFVSLYGISGAGKTSILRMLAGFMQPDSGTIIVNGHTWFGSKINISPQKRNAGFVFQDYALFPNMTVRENIAFAVKKEVAIVDELLQVTDLAKHADRKPHSLSGGQKQRVALARAIAQQPTLLLLDEPLSAIDRDMRIQLQDTLQEVHQRYKLTTIMVSHDAEEVVKLSDRVIHVADGKTTDGLLHIPAGQVTDIRQDGEKKYVTILVDDAAAIHLGEQVMIKRR